MKRYKLFDSEQSTEFMKEIGEDILNIRKLFENDFAQLRQFTTQREFNRLNFGLMKAGLKGEISLREQSKAQRVIEARLRELLDLERSEATALKFLGTLEKKK